MPKNKKSEFIAIYAWYKNGLPDRIVDRDTSLRMRHGMAFIAKKVNQYGYRLEGFLRGYSDGIDIRYISNDDIYQYFSCFNMREDCVYCKYGEFSIGDGMICVSDYTNEDGDIVCCQNPKQII